MSALRYFAKTPENKVNENIDARRILEFSMFCTYTRTELYDSSWFPYRETLNNYHHVWRELHRLFTVSSLSSLSSFSCLCSSLLIRRDLLKGNRSCGSRPPVYRISSLMQNVPWVSRGHSHTAVISLEASLHLLPPPQVIGVAGYEGVEALFTKSENWVAPEFWVTTVVVMMMMMMHLFVSRDACFWARVFQPWN